MSARKKSKQTPTIEREWWVHSTSATGAIMLSCRKTKACGIVTDYTKEEWASAYSAPSAPYRWLDNDRVTGVRESSTKPDLSKLYSPVEREAVVTWLRKRARHLEHVAVKPKIKTTTLSETAISLMERAGHLMNAAVCLTIAQSIESGTHLPSEVWEVDPGNPDMVRAMRRER